MSQTSTLAQIRGMGLVAHCADGEYRITFSKDTMPDKERREASAYYTCDATDALATARFMMVEKAVLECDMKYGDV